MYENLKVLFVDDEENILNSLRRGLLDAEYTCFFANSGEEALRILKVESPISVIVSDMRMPGMDGLKLLKIVKELYPSTVRIVLSGYAQLQQIIVTINQADIFRFITKPWKMEDEFENIIKQALDFYIYQRDKEKLTETLKIQNNAYKSMLLKLNEAMETSRINIVMMSHIGQIILKEILEEMKKGISNDLLKVEIATSYLIFEEMAKVELLEQKERNAYYIDKYLRELLFAGMEKETYEMDNKVDSSFYFNFNEKLLKAIVEGTRNILRISNPTFVKLTLQAEMTDVEKRLSLTILYKLNLHDDAIKQEESESKMSHQIKLLSLAFKDFLSFNDGEYICSLHEHTVYQKIILKNGS